MRMWIPALGLVLAALFVAVPVTAVAPAPSGAQPDDDAQILIEENLDENDLLISRERYFYSGFGRRDPFASLLTGRFGATGENDLLDVGEISLVGVVWGEDDTFALVQDTRDRAHVLRVGDRVVNGKVIEITRSSMTVQHYFFGETANITIHMQGDGDDE
jgi:hypothetical protein